MLQEQKLERLGSNQSIPVDLRVVAATKPDLLDEARAGHIHRASDRTGLFVSVNCGAISPTYADAELFGYAPGAHTSSASSRAGWFGSANGGTLYLDEIGDLPQAIQVKLLAALETHEVTRVGAHHPNPVELMIPDDWPQGLPAEKRRGVRRRAPWDFERDSAFKSLCQQFSTQDLKGFGCENLTLAIGAAGCLLSYAKETQRTALPHLRSLRHERLDRSEERRVGKECRSRWSPYH